MFLFNVQFSIDWQTLKIDYYSQANAPLCKWFESSNHALREHIKQAWINDMERLRVSISFFLWFPTYTSKHGLQNAFSHPSLQFQMSLPKIWYFTIGSSVSTIHAPADDLKLLLKGEPILATLFRKGLEGNDTVKLDDLKKVHQQLNYTNTGSLYSLRRF